MPAAGGMAMRIKRRMGTVCMILGTVLVLAALSLFWRNCQEDEEAGASAERILPIVKGYIEDSGLNGAQGDRFVESVHPATVDGDPSAMTEVEIDGSLYIGYLSVPALGLELPIMADWDYERLRIAPCRYTGSVKTDDLVIAAHNYSRHFGGISQFSGGEDVYFTDLDGTRYCYQVVKVETLEPAAVEEMSAGKYDLTLFTCTYGGASRVTVRCERSGSGVNKDANDN